jgi:hypothetical protein
MGEWANGRMARAPGGWRTLDFEDEDEDDFDDERPLDIGYWYWSFARSAQRMVAGQGASGSGRDWVFGERSKRGGAGVVFAWISGRCAYMGWSGGGARWGGVAVSATVSTRVRAEPRDSDCGA